MQTNVMANSIHNHVCNRYWHSHNYIEQMERIGPIYAHNAYHIMTLKVITTL